MSFTRAFAALGMVLALAACGKGGGGGTTVVGPNCLQQTCGGINSPTVLGVYKSENYRKDIVFSNMSIIAQSTNVQLSGSGEIYRTYSGPVAVQGFLDFVVPGQDLYSPQCSVPVGRYNVSTQSVGSMGYAGGDFVMPVIIAQGPATLEMRIESPLSTMSGGQLSNGSGELRLYSKVSILKVNGVVCSSNFNEIFN